MVFSFVKFPYASAQALLCSVADFIHPTQCHLQSNTLQVKGLSDPCMQEVFSSLAQGLSKPARIDPGNVRS